MFFLIDFFPTVCNAPVDNHATISSSSNVVAVGEAITITCKVGYSINEGLETRVTLYCLEDGKFSLILGGPEERPIPRCYKGMVPFFNSLLCTSITYRSCFLFLSYCKIFQIFLQSFKLNT